MHASETATEARSANGLSDVQERTLIDVFLERRSRRFALGADLHGGAMDFKSAAGPVPLSIDEEADPRVRGVGRDGARQRGVALPAARRPGDRRRPDHDEHGRADAVERGCRRDGDVVHHCVTTARYAMRRPQDFAPDEYEALVRPGPRAPLHRAVRTEPDPRGRSPARRSRASCRSPRPSTSGRRTSRVPPTSCRSPRSRRST